MNNRVAIMANVDPAVKLRMDYIQHRAGLSRAEVIEAAFECFECYCLGINLHTEPGQYVERARALNAAAHAMRECGPECLKEWGEALGIRS